MSKVNTEYDGLAQFYAEYNEDSALYCVFHVHTGKAHASFASMAEAEQEANKMNEPKMVGFDFIMDSFVSVQAPEGTDPDTLVDQAKDKFREHLTDGSAIVTFDSGFDE